MNLPVPNYRWGYGKLDGHKAMTCGMLPTNITISNQTNVMSVFPNPIENNATILFDSNDLKTLKLINSSGQIILTETIRTNSYDLNCKNLPAGLYLIVSEEKQTVNKTKILIL